MSVKLDLVFGLTMYQPPTQFPWKFQEIAHESYRPVLRIIRQHPKARIGLNVTASVLEQTTKLAPDVLELIAGCHREGKIFLANTAAYHPIFPFIPQAERFWQMRENLRAYKEFLGINSTELSGGFYLPEMAISEDAVVTLGKEKVAWTVADDESYIAHYRIDPPFDCIPTYSGVAVLFQSHFWQNRISMGDHPSGRQFLAELKRGIKSWKGEDASGYVVIWMDFETFGHHIAGYAQRFFGELFGALEHDEEVTLTDPQVLLAHYPQKNIPHVPRGSQSTDREDYRFENYYPKWHDSRSYFHRLWWELAYLAMEIVRRIDENKNPDLVRIGHKMLYSCQTWQYTNGESHLAQLGLPYFGEVLCAGNSAEQEKGRKLLAELYRLTSAEG